MFVEKCLGQLGFLGVSIAVTKVRQSMPLRQTQREIQRPNPFAGNGRIREFFIDENDMQTTLLFSEKRQCFEQRQGGWHGAISSRAAATWTSRILK